MMMPVAAPALMANEPLVALVRPDDDAVSVYVPVLSTLQPAKVAMPDAADFGFAVQVSVALPGVVRASVTEAVLEVIVLPPASCTVTTGCVPNAIPPVEFDG
jgi:hypothetical protein